MEHPPPLGPAVSPQAGPQWDSSSQGKLVKTGAFNTGKGKTMSVRAEEGVPKLGIGSADVHAAHANKQRSVSVVDDYEVEDGGYFEGSDPGKEGTASSEDDVATKLQTSESSTDSDNVSDASDNSEGGVLNTSDNVSKVADDLKDTVLDTSDKDIPNPADSKSVEAPVVRSAFELNKKSPPGGLHVGNDLATEYPDLPQAIQEVAEGVRELIRPGELMFPATADQVPAMADQVPATTNQIPIVDDDSAQGDSISISGGVENNSTIVDGDAISIEGGGNTTKKSFWKRLTDIMPSSLGKLWHALKNNPFLAATVLFIIIAISLTPYSAGAAALVFLSMSISLALASFTFHCIAKLPSLGSDLSQQNQSSLKNGQSSSSDKSASDQKKVEKKSESGSNPNVVEDDTDGDFFMTKTGPTAVNGVEKSSISGNTGARAADITPVESQDKKEFSLEEFDKWLGEYFGERTNEPSFAEFSKAFRDIDNYDALKSEGAISSFLTDLNQKRMDLSLLANSPLEESEGSGPQQEYRLREFESLLDGALMMLSPKPEYCRTMEASLMRVLSKDKFPWLSSNLRSPFLSIGVGRESVREIPRDEMVKLEATDFLKLTLLKLRDFADQKDREWQRDEAERIHQACPVTSTRPVDQMEESSAKKVKTIDGEFGTGEIEVKPVPVEEEILQVKEPDDRFRKKTEERQKRVLQKLAVHPVQLEIPRAGKKAVRFRAFFTNVKDAVENWDRRKAILERKSAASQTDLTAEQYQKLVVCELGKAVFSVGESMMRADNKERLENQYSERAIDIDSRSGRLAFLEKILESDDVADAFRVTEATDNEKDKAIAYLKSCMN